MTLTKRCSTCGDDLVEGNNWRPRITGNASYECTPCESSRNDVKNAITRIACRLARMSSSQFHSTLDKPERLAFRERARVHYEDGLVIENAGQREREKRGPEGDVYAITNPAWPGYVKIGESYEADSRCCGYQTSGPFRDWEVRHAVHFENSYAAEQEVLARLDEYRTVVNGKKTEWVKLPLDVVINEINKLRETL